MSSSHETQRPLEPADEAAGLPLNRHLQLIACAGAGKTEAVSRRLVRQMTEAGPAKVVGLTFNNHAAAELKDRVASRWESVTGTREGLADLFVGTIHGYCLELLQTHVPDALPYRILSDIQQRHLISRASTKSGLSQLNFHRYHGARSFAELVSILREADVDDNVLSGSPAHASLQMYLDLLHEKKYLDYTELLSTTVELLDDPAEGLRERLAGQIAYLTVDEYQDVNPIQERLIRHLVDLGAVLTVVGDDDQLLYGWRGSSVGNILEFKTRYPDVQTYELSRNFRSSRGIVDLARHVIANNDPDRLDKTMVSAGNQAFEEGDIQLHEFDDQCDEAGFIAGEIESLLGTPFRDNPNADERGLSYADCAVLVRVRKLIPDITAALDQAGVPYVVGGLNNLLDTPEADAARQLFYFLAGEIERPDLETAWRDADLGISDADLTKSLDEADKDRTSIEEESGRFGIYNLQRSYLRFLEALELREEKIPPAAGKHGHSRAEVVYYNLGKFSEIISDFEQIHFQSGPKQKYETFANFLRHQASDLYPEGWLETRYLTPNAVRIMTVHQAKGLQWPVVFVPGLTKNNFPARGGGGKSAWSEIPDGAVLNKEDYKPEGEAKLRDERRLFYVACTRAKKFLRLTRSDYHLTKQVYRTVSPFWTEASEAINAIDAPTPSQDPRKLEPAPPSSIESVEMSFSELKYAFECPYSFKLRFLYGFNPPIAEALGYGKGLHDALFEIHDRVLRGEPVDDSIVPDLVDRHLFLPFAYESLRDSLRNSALKRLNAYLEARGSSFEQIEHAERPIEIDLGDGIRVTGRIDLIRRKETNEVVVIDFKSTDRAQQEEVTDLQLQVYALGYEQATGERAKAVVIDNLDDLSKSTESAVTDEVLERARDEIRAAGDAMRTNSFPRRPSGGTAPERQKTCDRCDLIGICGGAPAQ